MTWRFALVPPLVLVTLSAGAFACASGAPSVSASAKKRERADTPLPVEVGCPAAEPTVKGACDTAGRLCTYASSLGCGSVYDCHLGTWRVRMPVACTDAHRGGACSPEPERDVPPETPLASSLLCLYSGATLCKQELDVPPQPCSGVPRVSPPVKFAWRCEALSSGGCAYAFDVAEGDPCAPEGASCGANCCGTSAHCVGGVWKIKSIPCPP